MSGSVEFAQASVACFASFEQVLATSSTKPRAIGPYRTWLPAVEDLSFKEASIRASKWHWCDENQEFEIKHGR